MEVLTKYGEIARAAAAMTTLLAVCKVLLGLLNCFLGYKLLKVWVSLCGFFIGLTVGFLAVPRFTQESSAVGWISLGIGVVSGILAYEIYLVGVFAVGWLMTVSLCFSLGRFLVLDDKKKIFLLVAGALVGIFCGCFVGDFCPPQHYPVHGSQRRFQCKFRSFRFTTLGNPSVSIFGRNLSDSVRDGDSVENYKIVPEKQQKRKVWSQKRHIFPI